MPRGPGDRGAGFDPTLLTADFPDAQPSLDSLNNSEYINIKKPSPAYGLIWLGPTSMSPAWSEELLKDELWSCMFIQNIEY